MKDRKKIPTVPQMSIRKEENPRDVGVNFPKNLLYYNGMTLNSNETY